MGNPSVLPASLRECCAFNPLPMEPKCMRSHFLKYIMNVLNSGYHMYLNFQMINVVDTEVSSSYLNDTFVLSSSQICPPSRRVSKPQHFRSREEV